MDVGTITAIIALVIASLTYLFHQHGGDVLRSLAYVLVLCHPEIGWCDSLRWEKLPSRGPVHQCTSNCIPALAHQHQKGPKCYEALFRRLFNGSYELRGKKNLRKPYQLDLLTEYFCTDMKTVLTFLLCTAPPILTEDWWVSDDLLSFHLGSTKLVLTDMGDFYKGHIEASFKCSNIPWSKEECLSILLGFPPFYRQPCIVSENVKFNHPGKLGDLRRGGWVIAVGLTRTLDFESEAELRDRPSPLYVMSKSNVQDACSRVRDVVQNIIHIQNIINHLHTEDSAELARSVGRTHWTLKKMCSGSPSGCLRRLPMDIQIIAKTGTCANGLTSEQCQLVVDLFNPIDPWTPDEYAAIRPFLPQVLAAAFLGVYVVLRYYRSNGFQLLAEKVKRAVNENKLVYLTSCK